MRKRLLSILLTACMVLSLLTGFSIVYWAEDAVKWCVGSGLIHGADGKLNPTTSITRAESATIILCLLQKSGLVDVRS